MKRIIKVCAKCGSDDVIADTQSRWNPRQQCWDISNIMDDGHSCNECADECELVDKDYAEFLREQEAALDEVAVAAGGFHVGVAP